MKFLLVVSMCIYAVLGEPTIKDDCDPTSAATGIDISVIDDDGNTDAFTSTSKLTVKFSLSKTFLRTSKAAVSLKIERDFGWFLGWVSIKDWMFSLAMRFIDLPPGVTHHKGNIFFVTCQAIDKYTTCPPAVGDTSLVVDFKPIFAQQAKLRNTLLGKFLGGDYKIHAEAVKLAGSDAGDSEEFTLTCLDVAATAIFKK